MRLQLAASLLLCLSVQAAAAETGAPAANGQFVSWNLLAARMVEEAASGADPTAIPER